MHNHLTHSKQYSVLVSHGHFESPFCGLLNAADFFLISSSIDIFFFQIMINKLIGLIFFLNFTRKIHILHITKNKTKQNNVQNLDSLILYNLDYCFMKVITFQYLLTQI